MDDLLSEGWKKPTLSSQRARRAPRAGGAPAQGDGRALVRRELARAPELRVYAPDRAVEAADREVGRVARRIHDPREPDILVAIGIERERMHADLQRLGVDPPQRRQHVARDHRLAVGTEREVGE